MGVRVAINGLGRIGRCVLRALAELEGYRDIEVVAVNGPAAAEAHAHLLQFDSVHGRFGHEITYGEDWLDMGFGKIALYRERDPAALPWKDLNIDIVLECTGRFNTRQDAAMHLAAGAKKVVLSAPGKNADATVVYGVNQDILTPEHEVISIGSCTTNCLAPVAKVLEDTIGIESGFMTTIHAYTGDQNILDGSHKDLRRARAAGLSMVPTSTGAAKALGLVLPALNGKLDGVAVRVPTPNVSLVDLTFNAATDTSIEAINHAMTEAANGALKGVLGVNDRPLVSIDFTHDPHSSIFDLTGTKVMNERLCRIVSWYDNEWGFSVRMLDITDYIATQL